MLRLFHIVESFARRKGFSARERAWKRIERVAIIVYCPSDCNAPGVLRAASHETIANR